MDRHIQNERIRAELIKQFLLVKKNLSKGKGTWPKPGYVRDSIWDGWLDREATLISLLRAGEIDMAGEIITEYGSLINDQDNEDLQGVEVPGE